MTMTRKQKLFANFNCCLIVALSYLFKYKSLVTCVYKSHSQLKPVEIVQNLFLQILLKITMQKN